MIELSLRNGFESSTRFASHPRARLGTGLEISVRELAKRVRGKRLLVLIHGYHTNVSGGMDAYSTIETTLRDRGLIDESGETPEAYERVVGIGWPSAALSLAFVFAWRRAATAGRWVAEFVEDWEAASVDIWTHSLGARVALEANSYQMCQLRNLILTEPAVGAGVLDKPYGEYYQTTRELKNVLVCHSTHDQVLRWAFRASRWTGALGLHGPSGPTGANVYPVDCSFDVDEHGAPKRSEKVFEAWKEMLTRCP